VMVKSLTRTGNMMIAFLEAHMMIFNLKFV
jgi:hypothetical protein